MTALTIHLAKGSHNDCTDGSCLFEAYNLIRFDNHTDDCPPDVSKVLHSFGITLNDAWDDEARQQLVRFLPQPDGTDVLAGTRDGRDEARGYLALDWLIRTYTPAWLDLAGLSVEAQDLRSLRRIVDLAAAEAAGPVVRNAQAKSAAARDAARDAAGAAAWAAAWADAEAAARNAARNAAWDAAGAAARDAARDAAGAAARAAAGAAAWNAARNAARNSLTPTVTTLQASALNLFDRMISPSADA